jgi:hypothetical protein
MLRNDVLSLGVDDPLRASPGRGLGSDTRSFAMSSAKGSRLECREKDLPAVDEEYLLANSAAKLAFLLASSCSFAAARAEE